MRQPKRKSRLVKYKKKKNTSHKSLIIAGICLLLIASSYLFLSLTTKYWSSHERVSLVINNPNGDLTVTTFNRESGEINNIQIPGSTQLVVSRQLGSWKAKSVWKLGENEKLGGELLRESIIKNFHFPVVAWADSHATGLASGNFWSAIKSIFLIRKTNLGVGDRIKMAIFSIGVNNMKRNEINLAQTSYLKKARLVDGEDGYLISGGLPNNLLIIFAEPAIAKRGLKANIIDASGKNLLGQDVGETLEVLGIKVASVEKQAADKDDCSIKGTDTKIVRKLAQLFSCQKEIKSLDSKFDIEFKIGESFAKRY